MRLYATVESERAKKGQGGNKFIRIKLTMLNERKEIEKFCILYYGCDDGIYSVGIDRGNGVCETILNSQKADI